MEKKLKPFFGKKANEEWSLFIFNKGSNLPILIENIGYTRAHPKYKVVRQNSNLFVFEYVLSGTGYIEINNQKYKVETGDVYCIEPGHDHIYYSDPNDPFEKLWINFYSETFKVIFKEFNLCDKVVFKNTDTLDLFHKLQSISKLSNFSDDLWLEAAPILFEIVCKLCKSALPESNQSKTAKITKEYLNESLYAFITMDDIAERMNLSKSHIIREFSKYYNCTPYNYLINQKISLAKKMLTQTNMNISEISDKLAFSDSHYFSRIFKRKTGLSPLKYKNNKINNK